MIVIENNVENRAMLFGDSITPLDDCQGYSLIFDTPVHVKTLYDNAADGTTLDGESWAYKKHGDEYIIDKSICRCDDRLGNIEFVIPIEQRVDEFISTHDKNTMYSIGDFSDWVRILTKACFVGRRLFLEENGLNINDKCTVGYFLEKIKNSGLCYALMPQEIKDYYKDDEVRYEAANSCPTV